MRKRMRSYQTSSHCLLKISRIDTMATVKERMSNSESRTDTMATVTKCMSKSEKEHFNVKVKKKTTKLDNNAYVKNGDIKRQPVYLPVYRLPTNVMSNDTVIRLHTRNRHSRLATVSKCFTLTLDDSYSFPVDMPTERRKNTYGRWPQRQGKWWPQMLANAGFFYLGQDVKLQCFSCDIITSVEEWRPNETPIQAHARINPDCQYIKTSVPKSSYSNTDNVTDGEKLETDCTSNNVNIPINGTTVSNISGLEATTKNGDIPEDIGNIVHQDSNHNNQVVIPTDAFKDGSHIENVNNPLYSKHTMQYNIRMESVADAMNTQLSIDGAHTWVPESEFKYQQYQSYKSRLRTYHNWIVSNKQTPEVLSEAGFFYTGENDIVRCFCCDLGLAEWHVNDNPWTEHARHSPKCLFLKNEKGIHFIETIQQDWRKMYNPRHAAFDDKDSRIGTFSGWRQDIEQTPEILAEAGFFYTGDEDVVRCHYCDGGLRNWEPGDAPWEEHAKWFPFCKYVIKMKGREYIEYIKRKTEDRQKIGNTHNRSDLTRAPARAKDEAEDCDQINAASNFVPNEKPEVKDPQTIKEMNRQLKERMKCIRCKTNDICMLFVNCGHRVTCQTCADKMDYCPHCDKKIKKRLKTFLS